MRLILIIVGAGLIVLSAYSANETRQFLRTAHGADGHVERLNAGGSHPQITFQAKNGEKVSYPQGGLIFGFRPGENVAVLYNPSAPASAPSVNTFGALWGNAVVECLAGIFLILTAAMSLGQRPFINLFQRGR